VRIELDLAGAGVAAPVAAAIAALVRGQLVVASARLAGSLGACRMWPLNKKPALRIVGRERDRARAMVEGVPAPLADRVRVVWDQALEMAMAHGLRNAALYPADALPSSAGVTETHLHRFSVRGIPCVVEVARQQDGRVVTVSVRCGHPKSAAGIILRIASTAITASLARGAALAEAVAPFFGTAFPPHGPTGDPSIPEAASPLDYACRWLSEYAERKNPAFLQ
jgi:hypothetical protein